MSVTPQQRRAIDADHGNVLVSASAGSGKTFVMISRIIRLITEGKASVGDILAVTFVKLAAQEMKEKLVKALSDEIAKGGEHAGLLKKQLAEVPTADFCTLHSFCANFLRKYFSEAGLDPRFQVMDEGEALVMKRESLDQSFEQAFEEGDAHALHLATVFSRRRKLDEVKEIVLKTYHFLWSEENPQKTAQNALEYYTEDAYDHMMEEMLREEKQGATELSETVRVFALDCAAAGLNKYAVSASECAEALAKIAASATAEAYGKALADWSFRMPSVRFKEDQAELGKEYQGRFKEITAQIPKLRKSAEPLLIARETGLAALKESRRTCEALIAVTLRFQSVYAENKKEAGKVDFSDLEHETLRLLENEDVKKEAAARYKYVFADEYQDINGAQESILRRLSNDNLFMVGDVKQSIYAFRGCNPDYFARKFSRFQEGDGQAILLNGNFRCSSAVLDTVNRTFARVMTKGTCGFHYREDGAMTGGELYGDHYGRSELHLVEESKVKREITPAVYRVKGAPLRQTEQGAGENEVVCTVLEELQRTWYDIKTESVRPVTYGDIAVLARNGTVIDRVATALAAAGIPVCAERKQSIVGYPEIRALIDLLRLICCAEQDGPLASVMLSPVGGFEEEELARIRLAAPHGSFCDAVRTVSERQDELGGKIRAFYTYFQTVRDRADFLGAGELLDKVIAETSFDVYYAACEGGENAIRRIRRFVSESRTQSSALTVQDFLDKATNMPSSFVLAEAGGENGVRVLSMHASKGLEFPVVILAGLGGKFNENDLHAEVMYSRSYGIAVRHYDLARRKKEDTVLREYMKRHLRCALAREEMRLLYVAMTRAKYALHLICPSVGNLTTDRAILQAGKMSDFLAKSDAAPFERAGEAYRSQRENKRVLVCAPNPALSAAIRQRLDYVYPHIDAVGLPSKTSVTRVASVQHEYYATTEIYGENSAEKGTAMHAVLEILAKKGLLSTAKNLSKQDLFALCKAEVSAGKIPAETLDLIDFEEAQRVVSLPVFGKLAGATLYPEQPFTVLLDARDLPPLESDSREKVLVQGVIDLLAVKDGKAWILDYKRTTVKKREDVLARYRTQLVLYRAAVEKVLGLPVENLCIVNLLSGEEIPVS